MLVLIEKRNPPSPIQKNKKQVIHLYFVGVLLKPFRLLGSECVATLKRDDERYGTVYCTCATLCVHFIKIIILSLFSIFLFGLSLSSFSFLLVSFILGLPENLAGQIFYLILFWMKEIPPKLKGRFHRIVVRPSLLYGVEC